MYNIKSKQYTFKHHKASPIVPLSRRIYHTEQQCPPCHDLLSHPILHIPPALLQYTIGATTPFHMYIQLDKPPQR